MYSQVDQMCKLVKNNLTIVCPSLNSTLNLKTNILPASKYQDDPTVAI